MFTYVHAPITNKSMILSHKFLIVRHVISLLLVRMNCVYEVFPRVMTEESHKQHA